MTTKIILLMLALVLTGGAVLLYYIGFFSSIVFEEKETGPFVLVYEEHIGAYKGTAQIQDKLYYSLINEEKIETYKGFGIYYDNPREVPTDELRSIAGCILEEKDYEKVSDLQQKGYTVKEIPVRHSIVTEFPFKNGFSIIAGIFRVYPKLNQYIADNNLSTNEIMEIYDVPGKKITYIMKK